MESHFIETQLSIPPLGTVCVSSRFNDEKIESRGPTLKDQEALENAETNNKGFSSYQIVYGANPKVPGILTSNPASLSSEFASPDVKKHIERINLARDAFRTADVDERVKRALKSRISPKNDAAYEYGDKVFFKEKENEKYKDEWSGPASVLGFEGKVLFLKYGNNMRRVHLSKVVKANDEYSSENFDNTRVHIGFKCPSKNTINTKLAGCVRTSCLAYILQQSRTESYHPLTLCIVPGCHMSIGPYYPF